MIFSGASHKLGASARRDWLISSAYVNGTVSVYGISGLQKIHDILHMRLTEI
jgi:hypothetical protein